MKTRALSDYFEAMTASVFQSGLSSSVVQSKWSGFAEAFAGFDPHVVAGFTPDDVDQLVSDRSIVRNRRKIEATVHNAMRILDLDQECGFGRWLDSLEEGDAKVEAIRNEFRFMGPSGTRVFLRMISEEHLEGC